MAISQEAELRIQMTVSLVQTDPEGCNDTPCGCPDKQQLLTRQASCRGVCWNRASECTLWHAAVHVMLRPD